jgi:hypothetical protein
LILRRPCPELGQQLLVTRERIRQIEAKALGVDEIAIRKGHTYRIVVSDLLRGRPGMNSSRSSARPLIERELLFERHDRAKQREVARPLLHPLVVLELFQCQLCQRGKITDSALSELNDLLSDQPCSSVIDHLETQGVADTFQRARYVTDHVGFKGLTGKVWPDWHVSPLSAAATLLWVSTR